MAIALRYAARSDLGLGPKSRNEDSGYAGPHLLVLADGMGGHAAGDVASSMIVGHLAPLDDEGIGADAALSRLERAPVAPETRDVGIAALMTIRGLTAEEAESLLLDRVFPADPFGP